MTIIGALIPAPAFAGISNQANVLTNNTAARAASEKTSNQKQSVTDKTKKFYFLINPWQTSAYNQMGKIDDTKETTKNNTNPTRITFWSALRTMATNAYNSLGRIIGFTTTENKEQKEEKTNKYNENGAVDSYSESSYGETTISPINGANYNTVGRTIQNTTLDIKPTQTATPTPIQMQRSNHASTSTPASQPTVVRTQSAAPSPTSSSRQRR